MHETDCDPSPMFVPEKNLMFSHCKSRPKSNCVSSNYIIVCIGYARAVTGIPQNLVGFTLNAANPTRNASAGTAAS